MKKISTAGAKPTTNFGDQQLTKRQIKIYLTRTGLLMQGHYIKTVGSHQTRPPATGD